MTHTTEDYLKAIFALSNTYGRATTSQLSEKMKVTPASVTGMLKRLAVTQPPLVIYQKHQGARLTSQGEKIALKVIRHHRLIESFLQQTLGYSWDEVHAEAESLEHVISDTMEERIAKILGNPLRDPHGDPIPTRDLVMPTCSETTLMDMKTGQRAVVQRVGNSNPDLLRYLEKLGLLPGAEITLVDRYPFDENLCLRVNHHPETIVLGTRTTRQIYVEVLE